MKNQVRIKIKSKACTSDVELDMPDDMLFGLKMMYCADMTGDSEVAKTFRAYIEACKAAKQ